MKRTNPSRRGVVPVVVGALFALTAVVCVCFQRNRRELVHDERYGTIRVHRVIAGNELVPVAGGLAQHVWELFLAIATPEFVAGRVIEYHVADDAASNYFAEVAASKEDNDRWKLVVNLGTADERRQLIETLVHELAHLVSLDSSQLDDQVSEGCTIKLEGGWARDDSMIWKFHQAFWSGYGNDAPHPDNHDLEIAITFEKTHEGEFVSDWAAMNVVEDFAESFQAFVFDEAPTGDSILDEKRRFFWNSPGEPERRQQIRRALDLDVASIEHS